MVSYLLDFILDFIVYRVLKIDYVSERNKPKSKYIFLSENKIKRRNEKGISYIGYAANKDISRNIMKKIF